MVHKNCSHCGAGYEVKPARVDISKFCSKLCQTMSSSIEKICECCSVQFRVPLRRNESVRFCSLSCKTAGRRKQVECAVCKIEFSTEAHKDRKYCSRGCFHQGTVGAKHAVDPDRIEHKKICQICGVEFSVTVTRKDSARFCSMACKSLASDWKDAISEKHQGEKHWRWTGGIYKNRCGYVRIKSKNRNGEVAKLSHREVVFNAIMGCEPLHRFIIYVDGIPRLRPDIEVHHIDRVRSNNDISNLLAVTKAAHAQIHHKNRKPDPWECWPSNPTSW